MKRKATVGIIAIIILICSIVIFRSIYIQRSYYPMGGEVTIKNIAQIVKSGGENAIEFFKKIFRIYYCSSFDYYPMCVCNCCSASSPEIASDNAQRSYNIVRFHR